MQKNIRLDRYGCRVQGDPYTNIHLFPQKRLYQRSVKSRINREDLNMLLAFTVERLKERVSKIIP